jgi:hypothetical protein
MSARHDRTCAVCIEDAATQLKISTSSIATAQATEILVSALIYQNTFLEVLWATFCHPESRYPGWIGNTSPYAK